MTPSVDHNCVECGRCVIKAEEAIGVRMTARCPRCDAIRELEPASSVLFRTYQCSGCERRVETALPRHKMTYCAQCGGENTMTVVDETRAGHEAETAKQAVRVR